MNTEQALLSFTLAAGLYATELLSSWLRQRRVVVALDSAIGAILIAFGLKLALDKAH
jgi:threonine/homoserine/homoserine lactone efflux protein